MTKFRTPKPANDHLAAFDKGDDLDSLTDAEIEARLAEDHRATIRDIRLSILRLQARSRP